MNKILTQRERRSHFNQAKRKNPILEANKYLEYLETHPALTYQDVAKKLGISKARVSQMIALVKKLPQEIIDYLTPKDDPEDPCHFTERKLRPLTLMESDEAKIERFREMKDGLLKRRNTGKLVSTTRHKVFTFLVGARGFEPPTP